MNTEIILSLVSFLSSGGLIYFLVQSWVERKKNKADTQSTIISNSNEVAGLYKKIDEIVESKTAPILDELNDIKAHWCCYREGCVDRLTAKPFERESPKE